MESSTSNPSARASLGRWTARSLAVLAVAATAIALYVVSSNSLDAGGGEDGKEGQAQSQPKQRPKPPETYTVQPGDSLGSISLQVGVPVERIEALNPDVDPVRLQAGTALKLRRE